MKWKFVHPRLNFIRSGPTVGPDGNVYAVDQYGLGFFSVTPQGTLRWSDPKVGDRRIRYNDVVFSAVQAYISHSHQDYPGLELMAFGMADGKLRWIRDADRYTQSLIGPGGRVYTDSGEGVWYSRSYNLDGSMFLNRQFGLGERNLSPDLTKLYASALSTTSLSAFDSLSLTPLWSVDTGAIVSRPVPDPLDRVIVAASQETYGTDEAIMAYTTSGGFLWREVLPGENGGTMNVSNAPVFAPDGSTVYFGTTILGQDPTNEYGYVYAYAVDASATARLDGVTIDPGAVNEGGIATGTVRLSAGAPRGGAVVTLVSSDAATASVPARVTVPEGQASASFLVTAKSVAFSHAATITARHSGLAKTALLMVDDVPPVDALTITVAEHSGKSLRLSVKGSNRAALVKAYDTATGTLIGGLVYRSGAYVGTFPMAKAPASVTVRSSLGGTATKKVAVR